MDLLIVHLTEATAIDGIPIDLVIDARATHSAHLKRFVVVFSEDRPTEEYPIPCLWVNAMKRHACRNEIISGRLPENAGYALRRDVLAILEMGAEN